MQLHELQRYALDAYRLFALWSLRYGRSKRVAELLHEVGASIKELRGTEEGQRHFRQIVCYLYKVAHESTHEPMLRSFNAIDPSGGEEVVTIAQRLRAEGLEEGVEKGRDKTAELVLQRLQRRFPEASPELRERVRSASFDELFRWSEIIDTASSVEDLLDA